MSVSQMLKRWRSWRHPGQGTIAVAASGKNKIDDNTIVNLNKHAGLYNEGFGWLRPGLKGKKWLDVY